MVHQAVEILSTTTHPSASRSKRQICLSSSISSGWGLQCTRCNSEDRLSVYRALRSVGLSYL